MKRLARISHHPSATIAKLRTSSGRAPSAVLSGLKARLRASPVRSPRIHGQFDALAAKAGEKSGLALTPTTMFLGWVILTATLTTACAPSFPQPEQTWAQHTAVFTSGAAQPIPMINIPAPDPTTPITVSQADPTAPLSVTELTDAGLEILADLLVSAPVADPLPRRLTLDDLRSLLLVRGKTIGAATQRKRAAQTRIAQMAAVGSVANRLESFGTSMMNTSTGGTMSTNDGWPPYTMETLGSKVATADVMLAQAQFASEVWEALTRLDEAAFSVRQERDLVTLYGRQHKLAKAAVNVVTQAYESGKAPLSTVLQTKNRADAMWIDHQAAQRRATAKLRSLAALLDLDADSLRGITLDLPAGAPTVPMLAPLLTHAEQHAPMVRMAVRMAERMTTMSWMLRRQLLPDLSTGLPTTTMGDSPRPGMPWEFLFGSPYLAEMDLGVDASAQQVDAVKRETLAEITTMNAELAAMVDMLNLIENHQLPRAEQAVRVVYKEYENGEMNYDMLDEVLNMQQMVYNERANLLRETWTMWSRQRSMAGGLP